MTKKLFNQINQTEMSQEEADLRADRIISILRNHLRKFGFPHGVHFIEFRDADHEMPKTMYVPISTLLTE